MDFLSYPQCFYAFPEISAVVKRSSHSEYDIELLSGLCTSFDHRFTGKNKILSAKTIGTSNIFFFSGLQNHNFVL